jgi:hypothetical protein
MLGCGQGGAKGGIAATDHDNIACGGEHERSIPTRL